VVIVMDFNVQPLETRPNQSLLFSLPMDLTKENPRN
jgi:hypothetical protein